MCVSRRDNFILKYPYSDYLPRKNYFSASLVLLLLPKLFILHLYSHKNNLRNIFLWIKEKFTFFLEIIFFINKTVSIYYSFKHQTINISSVLSFVFFPSFVQFYYLFWKWKSGVYCAVCVMKEKIQDRRNTW